MTTTVLSDVSEIHGGGRLGLSGDDFGDGAAIPAYGAAGLSGYLEAAEYADQSAVILSSIGARCGKCFLVNGAWTSLANTQVILPDPAKVDPTFLWYQLNDERRWHRSGSAQPFIKPSDVKVHKIFLPSLPEQRRIAAILDHADALRAKRREVLAHLDALAQSIFNGMFGDVTATSTVEAEASFVRTGPFGSQLLHSEFVNDGVAVLGLDNVVGNDFRWGERRFITPTKYEQLKRYAVKPGDVLISIMGTTGRCVVVPANIPTAINTKHICAITPNYTRIESSFLRAAFLWHPDSLEHLRRQTKGSIMDGLNMGIIKSMPIPVPSIADQQAFAARVEMVINQRGLNNRLVEADNELFASLQRRAFSRDN